MQNTEKKGTDPRSYTYFMVQMRTQFTTEYFTRIFSNWNQAYNFFLKNKADMIMELDNADEYEVLQDTEYHFSADYESCVRTITIEGLDLSDNQSLNTFFK